MCHTDCLALGGFSFCNPSAADLRPRALRPKLCVEASHQALAPPSVLGNHSVRPPIREGVGSSKSRKRPNTARRTAESSTSAKGFVQPGSSESHWVETYGRNGKVYFRNAEGKEVKTEIKDLMEEAAAACRLPDIGSVREEVVPV
ncbi:hypothetical protein ACJZ2D_016590 [Fusarium nematophilum]